MPTKTPSRRAKPAAKPAGQRRDISPEVRYYLDSRGYDLPADARPSIKTPEPRQVKGARFDPARVDRVIAALRMLVHTQGKWAGQSFDPAAWQVAFILAPVFGWVRQNEDGVWVRIIRTLFVEVPRKNGKTTLLAGLLLYLAFADGEAGAQVLAVAASKDQARFAFDPAKTLANSAPAMKAARVRGLRDQIVQADSTSYVRVVAAIGDLIHGANVHGACVDELHVHKSSEVLDAVESGTGAREQPLVVTITTAGDGAPESVYEHRRRRIDQLAKRLINDPSTYGVIFAADPKDDPFAETTWRRANPGLGVSPTLEFMRTEAAKAESDPSALSKFLRLHLGVRGRQKARFVSMLVWDRNSSIVDEMRLAGRECYGGLDLASVSDLNALVWLFPDDERGGYDVVTRFWTPELNVVALDKRTDGAASVWVKAGLLRTTPGDVTDYDAIQLAIASDREKFDAKSIGFDPWNATQLVNNLSVDGATMVKVPPYFKNQSPPMKELKRLLLKGTEEEPLMRHGGNPIMRWMLDNLAVDEDANGNIKPSRKSSADKIDGIAATVIALSEAMTRTPPAVAGYTYGLQVI